MNRTHATLWAAMVALLLSVPGRAADPAADQDKVQQVLSDLHHSNLTEIEIGKMAQRKGAREDVRAYGKQLVKDHENADRQVQDLAEKKGIPLTAPDTNGFFKHIVASREEDTMADLTNKSGSDFDKAFTQAMIEDHKRDINNLQSVSHSIKQADVRQLIAQLIPTLEQHLSQAQQLQGKV